MIALLLHLAQPNAATSSTRPPVATRLRSSSTVDAWISSTPTRAADRAVASSP